MPPNLQRRNRRDACRESETSTRSPAERRADGIHAGESTHRPGTSGNPRDPQKETVRAPENDAQLPHVKNNDASTLCLKETLALILTLAGGGGRPPKSRRQVTVPRSKDRGGNSDFPAGLAGGRLQTASQPSGKEASTMKPARNRAGGVEAVRRVQLHPSRISLSAQQTVKYM
ncbi:hypothetical protein NDU88_001080 [Pleurodeles waltl]|uniref:Uncharacterized protein n=1 Tax=Pleurodeles waltl TaxID=8319 RepID=A0AAV7Q602_PLEWA|nr:hypothetical protein NDU88_001080 [Pleurodeles waltl]